MRAIAEYVMIGRRQAVIVALLCSFVPFFGWLGTAVMGFVTLRKGITEGAIILLWIALPSIVLSVFGITQPLIENVLYGDVVAWFLAIILRQTSSWNLVLQVAAGLGAIGVLVAHLLHPDIATLWIKILNATFVQLQKTGWRFALNPEELKIWIGAFAKIATGVQTVFILCLSLLSLSVARWWQAMLYNPGGFSRELYQLRLKPVAAIVLSLALLLAASGVTVVWDTIPVLLMPFFFAGLCLFHNYIVAVKAHWIWLGAFYVALALFFPQIAILLAVLAFVDVWVNFRNRFGLKIEKR